MRYSGTLCLFAVAIVAFLRGAAYGADFMPLPQLPGSTQAGDAFAASADGSTVVGTSHDGRSNDGSTNQAVRWATSGAIQSLGVGDSSLAQGVSADGTIVVGYCNVLADQIAFRWTAITGFVNIGDLPGGQTSSRANDVSADGSVVVGLSFSTEGRQGFRWTAPTGIARLGDLEGESLRAKHLESPMTAP
jgi:uncharacterized membrane protein